jgi:1-acyl-sn-glycerol-3-phosphate acyltransferase
MKRRRLAPVPWILSFAARVFFRCTTRITVVYDEPILPQDGPLIVTPNHISNADPPLVAGWVAPALGRRPHFLAKESLFKGIGGTFLRWQGAVPVKAGGSDPETYRIAKKLLDTGEVLVIFPEGTRSQTGVLGKPLPGAALLATRAGVPIVPVGISGTDDFLRRGSRLLHIGARITVHVGRPYTLTAEAGQRRAGLEAASQQLMGHIAALIDERHRGDYDPVP